ncbi:beta-xylosidase family glycoside hydrolase [Tichowtungia aerotolerans]|uniref:Beta-xylosidase C-terminal Concanavalin A-like domain-containing protein n=1 Tax=Tichowtungia aerotolerans TaxID=2697043 RepID=A0A6P1M5W8_9BACT|nr:hypothetical protein [Tichowtungia aerotolerans]QHI68393.1 hypothetical protein GT409_02615 [Tichowtungia aerotolerans]
MKTYITGGVVLLMVAGFWAEGGVLDDFNRVDTDYSVDSGTIGNEWESTGSVTWTIQNGMLSADHNVSGEYAFYNRSEEICKEGTGGFEICADVIGMFGGAWAGVVFNYQNPDNFYAIRFQAGTQTYQFVKVVNGRISAAVSRKDASCQFAVGAAYRIKVICREPYKISFEITEAGESTVLNPTTVGTDRAGAFKGGYAGVYVRSAPGSARPDALFDNLSATVLAAQSVE